jgi:hypothetical protein
LSGTINLDGGTNSGGEDAIGLSDVASAAPIGDSVTLTASTLTGASAAVFNYTSVEVVNFAATSQDDTIDVMSTAAGTGYRVTGGPGSDSITIGNETSDFDASVFDGSLDAIQGDVLIQPDSVSPGSADILNVDDSGTASLQGVASMDVANFAFAFGGFSTTGEATVLTNFAPAVIRYFHNATSGNGLPLASNRLEFFNLRASSGGDTINVNATTATVQTVIDAFLGNDANTVTINGDGLSADNLFLGNEGTDRFVLNITANLGATGAFPLTSLEIRGDDPTGNTTRDSLEILDASNTARDLVFDYQDTAGAVDIEPGAGGGLGAGAEDIPVIVRTMETLIYRGGPTNDDSVRVEGTSADDDLTVAPLSSTSAVVFLGGNPWDGPTDPEPFDAALPGMADGGPGPDIQLRGLAATAGITVDGSGGTNNRLFVYGTSEADLSDGTAVDPFDPAGVGNGFGFGDGVLIPGSGNAARPGGALPNAFDEVIVSDTQVRFVDNAHAPTADVRVRVRLETASFDDADTLDDDLIVNTGNEACVPGQADDIVATLPASATFGLQINGGDPTAPCAPSGDRLSVQAPAEVNIFSDKLSPPNVTVTSGGSGQIGFSSIERALFTPGNGVVNLVGDNNDPAVDQTDNYIVRGEDVDGDPSDAGVGEFSLRINGDTVAPNSAAIFFNSVQFLNAFGESLNPDVTEPSGDVDTLEITPYADNTPRGWGIQVTFDESDPAQTDGDQSDLLIYNTVAVNPVSEDIIVQPSGTEDGELRVTNGGFGTPIVTISYTNNLDIIVNDNDGFASDTDTLTLRGTNPDAVATSGQETVTALFNAAGTVAEPMVVVADSSPLDPAEPLLYRLRNFTNFDTINFELLGGNDVMSVVGRDDGSLTVNVDGGEGSDEVVLPGTTDADDQFTYLPGTSADSGSLAVERAGLTATTVHFADTETVSFDGGGGEGQDRVQVQGTDADNDFFLSAAPGQSSDGSISIDIAPLINFRNLGINAAGPSSDITMLGLGGDDTFTISHEPAWQIDDVNIVGGTPFTGDTDSVLMLASNNLTSDDTVAYTPVGENSGDVDVTADGSTTNYIISSIGVLRVDAGEETTGDVLNVTTPNAVISPGATPGSGRVEPTDINGAALLPLDYANFESVHVTGTTAVIQGTGGDDTITVDANGVVSVWNLLGFVNSVDVSGFNALVINALGGNDTIDIEASGLFPGGITLLGGESDPSSDSLVAHTAPGVGAELDFQTDTLSGIVGGPVTIRGVEDLTISGQDGSADDVTVRNYGAVTDVRRVVVDGGDADNDDGDTLAVIGTTGLDAISYKPSSASTAQFARGADDATIDLVGFSNVPGLVTVDLAGNSDAITLIGSSSGDIVTAQQVGTATRLSSVFGGTTAIPIDVGNSEAIVIEGGLGNDELIVDEVSGLVAVPSGITYHGGSGNDLLQLINGASVDASYNVGPDAGAGSIHHVTGNSSQSVYFTGLEPVFDFVPGSLAVNATNASNAINYVQGTGGAAFGLVSIDGFETIEFTNKTTLTINALSGDDTIHLNNASTPTGLAEDCDADAGNGIQPICVDGGDPTASDTLILNGVAVTTSIDTSLETVAGASGAGGAVGIRYDAIESITVNATASSTLEISGSHLSQGTSYSVTPGLASDEGTVQTVELAVRFTGLGAGKFLNLVGDDVDGDDVLSVYGTNADDSFNVIAGTGSVERPGRATISQSLMEDLQIIGLDGDDAFTVSGPQPYLTIELQGGNPSGSDNVTLNGTAAAELVELILAPTGDTATGVVGSPVLLVNVENLTINSLGDNDTLSVTGLGGVTDLDHVTFNSGGDASDTMSITGTAEPDVITVTPTSATSVTASANGVGPVVVTNLAAAASSTYTVSGADNSDIVVVLGTALPDTIQVTRDTNATVTVNGLKTVTVPTEPNEQLVVNSGLGDDSIIVSDTAGPAISLTIDGGLPTASDSLTIDNFDAGTTTVAPGSTPDSGVVTTPDGVVSFLAIEFLNLNATGAISDALVTQGTNGSDSIALQRLLGGNRVWVNDRAVVTFTAFETITLDGRFGDDQFSVSPLDLIGLTGDCDADPTNGTQGICVIGGDPTASDRLIVNGSAATNLIDVFADGPEAGRVTVSGAPSIAFATTEAVHINGQDGQDQLAVISPSGSQLVQYNPGIKADEGTVDVGLNVRVTFNNLGGSALLTLSDIDGARVDSVLYNGTQNNETFTLLANGTVTLSNHITVDPASASDLTLSGLDGDDTFNLNSPVPAGLTNITLSGGNPSASDVANLTGDGTAMAITLGSAPPSTTDALVTGGGLGTVAITGVEFANLNTAGGDLAVSTTADDDTLRVTPLDTNSGRLEANDRAPVVNFSNTGSVTVDLGNGNDHLIVTGSSAGEVIDVTPTSVTVGTREAINYVAVEALSIEALQGSDTINVTASPTTAIFVDGGDPIGVLPGDVLNIVAIGGVVFFAGPEIDEGGFLVGANQPISFNHIESITVTPGGPGPGPGVVIFASNADDDITIIARDGSTHAGADGVQDFTVTVNTMPEALFINQPVLVVEALNGDDDITLRTPAPNNAVWDVDVTIIGGPPSAANERMGDSLVVETPYGGAETVEYTPTSSETGTMNLVNLSSLVTIANTAFCAPPTPAICPPVLPPALVVGGNGGIERLIYDGEGDDDSVNVIGTAAPDTILHTPGDATDAGSIRVNSLLALAYQNLGVGAVVSVSGGAATDTLVALGTGGSDRMTAIADSGNVDLISFRGNHLDLVRGADVEQLELNGLEGDDAFIINSTQPYQQILVNGGGPGGSDSLSVNGAAGVTESFVVTPAIAPHDGLVEVNAVDMPYTGIEHIFLDGNTPASDTLVINDDSRDNVWDVSAGTAGDLVQIDGRESIDYDDFSDVELVNTSGTDLFRVRPTNLVGFDNEFRVTGDAGLPIDDVLQLIGTPGDDDVFAATPPGNIVEVNGVEITAGANLIEVQVTTLAGDDVIDLSLDLAGVRISVDSGAGFDSIDMSGTVAASSVIIHAGDDDDSVTGSPVTDFIDGGRGNDGIFGLAGVDTIYGADGNDTIDGDQGNDQMFGEAGSDLFIWDPGDGSDLVEGGSNEADVMRFNGSAAPEVFNLFAQLLNPARTHLTRSVGNIVMDIAGIEQVDINTNVGNDVVIIGRANDDLAGGQVVSPANPTATLNDLTTTHVRVVNVDLNGDSNQVYVDGRPADDNMFVSVSGVAPVVTVAGLTADIKVIGADSVDDRLTIRGNEGNDTVKSAAGVEGTIQIRLDGGVGNDLLSADATILGGSGDDFLEGGPGIDHLCGLGGNDTLFGGNDSVNDLYDGGTEFDTILVHGTQPNAGERINLRQNDFAAVAINVCDNPVTEVTTLDYEILDIRTGALYVAETETIVTIPGAGSTVEEVRIEAGGGSDVIQVATADALFDNPAYSLRTTVVGGDDSTQDRLAVVDDGTDDLVLYRKSELDSAGTVTVGPGNAEPFQVQFEQVEIVQFVDENGNQINDEGIENPAPGLTTSRLVVFKHDPFEYNDDRFTATHVGANQTINLDPTIDPGAVAGLGNFGLPLFADKDYFQIEAEVTGTLDVQVFFEEVGILPSGRPGLPNNGNLDIQLLDADGSIIATSNLIGDNERIRVPAVEGQIYYLRVLGAGNAINVYDVTIINHEPPVPYDIELDDFPLLQPFSPVEVCTQEQVGLPDPNENSDSGRSQFDDVTCDRTPTIRFRIDDAILLQDVQGNDNTPAGFPNNPPDRLIPIPFNPSTSYSRVDLAPGFRIAIFEEGSPQQPEVFPYGEPQIPVGFAQPVPGVAGVYEFTFPDTLINTCPDPRTGGVMTVNGLCDGSHFISARVQMIDPSDNDLDPATQTREVGYGDRSVSLEIIVDAIDPTISISLHPESDSRIVDQPATNNDEVTNDTTPTFFGTAEANAVVRIYLDTVNPGTFDPPNALGLPADLLLGTTVALPEDGTNQFPNGHWTLTTDIDLNDPTLVLPLLQAPGTNLPDGRRLIFATAEDVSGNIGNQTQAGAVAQLEIFLDTRGPQITNVFFDPIDPAQALRSVFDPKPLNNTPTPLTSTLRIDVRDLPARFLQPATPLGTDGLIPGGNGPFGFQYPALNEILAEELGNYKLVGDQWGEIEIISATFVSLATADDTTVCPASNGVLPPAGLPGNNSIACGFIELEFDMPLPDDRYTLTIFDRIKDDAGNALDGEANTTSPTDTPNFPSGDGEPGDSFQARFTVDSRPEIGTFCCGSWYVDLNGNGTFDDPNNHDTDFTNGDIVFKFGLPSDFPVVGDWNNDGFDEIGVYGRRADGFRFELDLNGNGTFDTNDISFLFNATGPGAGGRPVAGRWNPGQNGDHVAVFNGTTWIVDVDTDAYTVGAPNVAPDVIVTAARGRPIVADFNGDGDDDAGLFQSTTNTFVLDLNSDDNFQVDTTIV